MENTEKRILQNDENLEKVVGGTSVGISRRAKIINCDYANVRSAAGGGDVIGKIKVGTIVEYLGGEPLLGLRQQRQGDWLYLQR